MISIVVPVLDESERINLFLDRLYGLEGIDDCEVIVVDGNPAGGTVSVIKDRQVVSVISKPARGRQLNAGAAVAKGDILLFLHADTTLPAGAVEKIQKCLADAKNMAGAFELGIDSDRLIYKWIAFWAHIRYKYFGLPYGDQAIFMRKDYFESIGGFADYVIMEDVDLVRRIRKLGDKVHILPEKVSTSARRWEKEGAVYGTVRNSILLLLFCAGVKPDRLVKYYSNCPGDNLKVERE